MKRTVLLALFVASVAHADTGMLPGGVTLNFVSLWTHQDNNPNLVQPSDPIATMKYFNFAHCECSWAQEKMGNVNPDFTEGTFAYLITATPASPPVTRPIQFWSGSMCDQDATTRMTNCTQIMPLTDPGFVSNLQASNGAKPELHIYDVLVPKPPTDLSGNGCNTSIMTGYEWLLVDSNGDGNPDYFTSQAINADTVPPDSPTQFTVEGAESAINISWTAPANTADTAYYQALCSTLDGNPVHPGKFTAQYVTPFNLCGFPENVMLAQFDLPPSTDPDAATGPLAEPAGISTEDPAFICGEVDSATATSMRIEGLQNDVPYAVALLAIDKFGNASGTFFTSALTPHPVTDFWEDIHKRGGQTQGGLCLLAETYGNDSALTNALRGFRDDTLADTGFGRWLTDAYYAHLAPLGEYVHGHIVLRVIAAIVLAPLVVVALAWHYLTLPGLLALIALVALRRRLRGRIPRHVVAAAAALALFVVPAIAHAQTPYWENQPATSTDTSSGFTDESDQVDWHVGFKIGPYIPQIDAHLGLTPGPYEMMFGSKASWMPMLDVERVIMRWYGQVTVGLTAGYMGKTAHAWVDGSSPNDPMRPRSPGDTNSFRLIPLAATASYRYTYLDDELGIPVVPYFRGGLSYYVWWITGPDGNFATVMGANKAYGASLGVQGAIGLAIRAERIDEAAARSMREGGIEHAGFFGEFQAAKVDGFGSDKKLGVGDNTWFAGVDFEF
jgi:hypothetical protein